MKYKEEVRDLFSVPEDYYLAHCISADFALGAGIAVQFNKHFDMKNVLKTKYPDYLSRWEADDVSDVILEGRVFNLITKKRYWQKPTYESMKNVLLMLKAICKEKGITKVAMPLIGCGIDGLEWERVSIQIKRLLADSDIEILVCRLN